MSSKNIVKVPKIAVTVESDDNDTQKLLSIEETHTDVEDLGFPISNKTKPKSRLKIKISNSGYVTDTEDLEMSGGEEEFKIPLSSLPDDLFDLDGGLVEEVQKNDLTSGKVVCRVINRSLAVDDVDDGVTDVEECYTESELEDKEVLTVNMESYELESSVRVSEKVIADDHESDLKKSKSRRRRRRRNKQNSAMSPSDDDDDTGVTTSFKTLAVPSADKENLTDVEDIEITENRMKSTHHLILEEELKEQERTDIENFESDTDVKQDISFDEKDIDDLVLEKNFSATRCTKTVESEPDWKESVKFEESENSHLVQVDDLGTDDESLSDFDCCYQQNRAPSPNLQLSEQAIVFYKERSKESDYLQKTSYISDTEEVVIAGDVKPSLQPPKVEDDCLTETEDLDVDATVKTRKKLSVSSVENIEFSDDEETSKEVENRNDQEAANYRKKKLIEKRSAVATDVEDLDASCDEAVTFSRAETATPVHIHHDLDSMCSSKVRSEHMKKVNLNTSEEQFYTKGGGCEEARTDLEDLSVSEEDNGSCRRKRFSVDLVEDRITVTVKQMSSDVPMKWKNYTVKFGITGGEGNKIGACSSLLGFLV